MELNSERLILRELRWDFLNFIHQMNLDPNVAMFNTIGIPESIENTRELIRSTVEDVGRSPRKHFGWAIFLKENDEFIGQVGMSNSADRFKLGEIHYSLLPSCWGRGYGSEATKSVIDFGFNVVGLHRIHAGVAVDNEKSIKLLEKVGMTREGRKRKILPIRGEWRDNYQYAIIEDDMRDY